MSKYSENLPLSLKGAIEWFYNDIEVGSTVLDFGCSTGYFGAYLKKHKQCTVYGVEISEDIKEAKKVLDGVYSFDLDREWPKQVYERRYDALFFGDVIEHLKDPALALKKASNLLKPKGKVFISTPNIAHMSTRLELLGGNFEYEKMGILDNTHLKYFTINSLKKLAKDAGYQIERLDSSTNDYPRGVIEKILKQYGLTPAKKFWDMAGTIEARAFQYKLVLSRSKTAKSKKSFEPVIIKKPEQFRDDFIQDLNSQIKKIKQHADKQANIIDYWKQKAEQLEGINKDYLQKINRLESSGFHRVKRVVKRRLKK